MESMKLHCKLHCCVLALAMTLVTTCVMGGQREKVHKRVVEALEHRNEIEEHWERQFKAYSPTESENSLREGMRMRPLNKQTATRSERRTSEMLGTRYKSF